jgi:hypothetical protein
LCVAERRDSTFKTGKLKTMRKMMKKHGNKVHKRYKVPDEELFREIRVQTWFRGNGEARYWRVEEGDGVAEETPAVHGGSGIAGVIDGEGTIDEEGTCTTDDTTNAIANAREPLDTREEARAAVIVIDSDDEDFVRPEEVPIRAAEGDNRDESVSTPEKESTATGVDIDSDNELLVLSIRHSRALGPVSTPEDDVAAAGIVNDSDDEVLLPSSRRHISAVEVESGDESDGDAEYIPSEEASSDDDSDSSTVGTEASDVEHGEARQLIVVEVTRKRKVRPATAHRIGSDSDPYQQSSPRVERSPKRQQRSPRFEDSGVVMPPSSEPRCRSSADDGFIITSSPPIMGRTIRSQPEGDDRLRHTGRVAVPVTHDTDEIPQGTVPSPVPFVFGRRQPTTDALREHLETWC